MKMRKIILFMLSMLVIMPFVIADNNPFYDNYNTGDVSVAEPKTMIGGVSDFGGDIAFVTDTQFWVVLPEGTDTIKVFNNTVAYASFQIPNGLTFKTGSDKRITALWSEDNIFITFLAYNSSSGYDVIIKYQYDILLNIPTANIWGLNGNTSHFDISCVESICMVQAVNSSGTNTGYTYSLFGTDFYSTVVSNTDISLYDKGSNGSYRGLYDSNSNFWFFQNNNGSEDFFIKLYDLSRNVTGSFELSLVDDINLPYDVSFDGYVKTFLASPYEIEFQGSTYYSLSYDWRYNLTDVSGGAYFNLISPSYNNLRNLTATLTLADLGGMAWDSTQEHFILDSNSFRRIYDFSFNSLNTTSYSLISTLPNRFPHVYTRLFKSGLEDKYDYNAFVNGSLYNDSGAVSTSLISGDNHLLKQFGDNDVLMLSSSGSTIAYFWGSAGLYDNKIPEIVGLSPDPFNPTIYSFVDIIINAVDEEDDKIYYWTYCDWKGVYDLEPRWSADNINPCYFDTGGVKTIRVFVSDERHGNELTSYQDITLVALYNLTEDLSQSCEFTENFNYIESIKLHNWNFDKNTLVVPDLFKLDLEDDIYLWRDVDCARTVYNLTFEVFKDNISSNYGELVSFISDNDVSLFNYYHSSDNYFYYTDDDVIKKSVYYDIDEYNVSLDVDVSNLVWSLKFIDQDNGTITQIVTDASINKYFMLNPTLKKIAINNFYTNNISIDNVRLVNNGGFIGDINLDSVPTIDEIREIEAFEGSYEFAGFQFEQSQNADGYRSDNFNYTRCDLEGYKYSTCPLLLFRDEVIKKSSNYVFNNFLYFIVFLLSIIIIVVIVYNIKK